MEKRPISELLETTMQKVNEMTNANTIIGEAISTSDGVTLIPVSKVSVGFGGGGSDIAQKKEESNNAFGGGVGVGVKIEPVAFIVVKDDGSVKMLHVAPPAESTIDRLIENIPDLFDKVADFVDKKKEK